MSDRAVIAFAPFVFEGNDLFVLPLLNDFGGDFRAGDQRIAVSDVLAIGEHQHFAEGRGLARIDIEKIDIHRVAFRDAILPSAGLDDCVGHNVFSGEKKPRKITQKGGFDKRKGAAYRQPSPAASRLPLPGQGEAAGEGRNYFSEINSTLSPCGGWASSCAIKSAAVRRRTSSSFLV